MLCHGNGNNGEGCCFIEGQVCPLRWKIEGGHIYNYQGTDLGATEAFIVATIPSNAGRTRARDQIQGVKFICRAAIEVLIANAKLLTNRADFEAAWHSHPDYQNLVRPAWAIIEQNIGWAPDTYNCMTWKGTSRPQCCFEENATVNATTANTLSTTTRTLRQAGGV